MRSRKELVDLPAGGAPRLTVLNLKTYRRVGDEPAPAVLAMTAAGSVVR